MPTIIEPALPLMTYEEFLDWASDETHAEWVDGRVEIMSPVSNLHSKLDYFLGHLLSTFLDERPIGEVRGEPFQMRLRAQGAGRSPDMIFVRNESALRVMESYLEGPADAVFEIVSRDSRKRDYIDKFKEYERAGVPEYWIIDPVKQKLDVYSLNESGKYEPLTAASGILRSKAIEGFWIRPEWLWSTTRVTASQLRREWGFI